MCSEVVSYLYEKLFVILKSNKNNKYLSVIYCKQKKSNKLNWKSELNSWWLLLNELDIKLLSSK